jgi:DNA-binding PadR family transcriptional regulator
MRHDGPRLTAPTLKVLGALMSSPLDELSGADIARNSKLASGTLYPILFRLEEAGWVESRWEAGDPHLLGRPRRRYYRVTPLGATSALAAMDELKTAFARLAWG